ncbi:MAG TPA: UDP-N-acetylmuramate--L-alanine ligase [Flavobacteriaceae bacterium]|nr:UDP-N-acetylmuramate--L-alanine ligase [Flavobacteriaceae bacterium]
MSLRSSHTQYERFIFLGIGGIGMSALARYLAIKGKAVLGYDRTASDITHDLRNTGAEIVHHAEPNLAWFDSRFSQNTLIVWTPAVAQTDAWMIIAKSSGIKMMKRAELLGMISAESQNVLAIAGTHGKTTTSAILAHLLVDSGKKGIGFLGGIAQNYQSNLILSPSFASELADGANPDFCVVEADEFDRSFLWIHPQWACITSVDPDHLDIYQDKETFVAAFSLFAQTVDQSKLLVAEGLDFAGVSVGFSDQAQIRAEQVQVIEGVYHFNLRFDDELWTGLTGPLPGRHNLVNVMMAVSMARGYGLTQNEVALSLANFRGIQRRFNRYTLSDHRVLIDDYAHHPTELKALLQGVKEFYANQPHVLLFQPHLFSRTRDFADDFAQVFNEFDRVILMPIYPARELPISGVDSAWLATKCDPQKVRYFQKAQAIEEFIGTPQNANQEPDSPWVFIVAGAGDIGLEVKDLIKKLS